MTIMCGILLIILCAQSYLHYKERDKLTTKLMADSFHDYSVHETAMAHVEREPLIKEKSDFIHI